MRALARLDGVAQAELVARGEVSSVDATRGPWRERWAPCSSPRLFGA